MGYKKRVAIISRHAYPNYGSLFQAYALQCTIDEMGYDAFYIDYQKVEEQSWKLAFSSLKESKMNSSLLKKIIYLFIQTPNYYLMNKRFKQFQKKWLKMTGKYSSYHEIQNNVPEADIYITGSDQVWNSIHNKIDYTYFLNFLNEDHYKISYAASFGKENIPTEEIEKIRQSLLQYKNISVREISGLTILKSLGLTGKCVLDPVFLLSKEKWNQLTVNQKAPDQKYLLVYQLHFNEKFDHYVDLAAKANDLQIIRISTDYKQIKKSGRLLYLPEPVKVLSYFKNAEMIITDSFHASSFSLIFNKNFQVILPDKNIARLTDLLIMFDSEKVIVRDFNAFTHKEIDYIQVNKAINEYKYKSKDFLIKALQKL